MSEKLEEAVIDFANAVEAACVQLRISFTEAHGVKAEKEYTEEDFNKLFWETKESSKGPYQQTSKKATNNYLVFRALQAIIKEHKGFCHIGAYAYWFDQGNVDVIDRRRK